MTCLNGERYRSELVGARCATGSPTGSMSAGSETPQLPLSDCRSCCSSSPFDSSGGCACNRSPSSRADGGGRASRPLQELRRELRHSVGEGSDEMGWPREGRAAEPRLVSPSTAASCRASAVVGARAGGWPAAAAAAAAGAGTAAALAVADRPPSRVRRVARRRLGFRPAGLSRSIVPVGVSACAWGARGQARGQAGAAGGGRSHAGAGRQRGRGGVHDRQLGLPRQATTQEGPAYTAYPARRCPPYLLLPGRCHSARTTQQPGRPGAGGTAGTGAPRRRRRRPQAPRSRLAELLLLLLLLLAARSLYYPCCRGPAGMLWSGRPRY